MRFCIKHNATLFFVLGALLASIPARASSSSCASIAIVVPEATGCAAVDSTFNNTLQSNVTLFGGTFLHDNDIQVITIDITDPFTNLLVQSYGYGGGTDLTGTSIPTSVTAPYGGFATELELFASNGTNFATSQGNSCDMTGLASSNPTTSFCFDANLQVTIPTTGTYYLVVTENDNYFTSGNLFSSGTTVNPLVFNEGGGGQNFTSSFCASPAVAPFCDPLGDQMNGNYSIDVSIGVPEPGSFVLVISALACLPLVWRRRRHPADRAFTKS